MEAETFLAATLLLVIIGLTISTVYAIQSNKLLTKRQKANLTFLVISVPVAGDVIYGCLKNGFTNGHSSKYRF